MDKPLAHEELLNSFDWNAHAFPKRLDPFYYSDTENDNDIEKNFSQF